MGRIPSHARWCKVLTQKGSSYKNIPQCNTYEDEATLFVHSLRKSTVPSPNKLTLLSITKNARKIMFYVKARKHQESFSFYSHYEFSTIGCHDNDDDDSHVNEEYCKKVRDQVVVVLL